MEESTDVSVNHCCIGCLRTTNELNLYQYNLKCEPLESIFQMKSLTLCYICQRIMQHTELFIQNVQSNQILLENFHGAISSTLDMVRPQIQPVFTLTHTQPSITELPVLDNDRECFTIVHSSKKFDMKMELKEEELIGDGDYHSINGDDYPETIIKDEDDFLLKEKVELDDISLKDLKQELRKQNNNKKKMKKEDILPETSKIKMITITKKQCMEERKKMEKDKKYLNCPFKCTDCIKGFIFEESYKTHMERHSLSMGDYMCNICKLRMDSNDKLIRHSKCHTTRYKCTLCSLTRVSRPTLRDHVAALHGDQRQHICKHCGKTFYRSVSLRKHILYAHSNRGRVQCKYCIKTYANKDVLKAHMIMHHPSEVSTVEVCRRHVCRECGGCFKTPSQLKNHTIKHSTAKDYYCVECDKSFKSDAILKHHLKTALPHVNYLELPLCCDHCDKRFAIKRDLEKHMNRIHLNVRPFACDICDKAYVSSWSLREHKKYIHEGFKRPLKYPCPMCDKMFDRNAILKSHIRTHTGERPYCCNACPAQFAQRSVLATHHRLVHLKQTRDGRPKVTVK